VLRVDSIVFCGRCEAASARTERGWRAYLFTGQDGAQSVAIVCPACAESCFGEDESEPERCA